MLSATVRLVTSVATVIPSRLNDITLSLIVTLDENTFMPDASQYISSLHHPFWTVKPWIVTFDAETFITASFVNLSPSMIVVNLFSP